MSMHFRFVIWKFVWMDDSVILRLKYWVRFQSILCIVMFQSWDKAMQYSQNSRYCVKVVYVVPAIQPALSIYFSINFQQLINILNYLKFPKSLENKSFITSFDENMFTSATNKCEQFVINYNMLIVPGIGTLRRTSTNNFQKPSKVYYITCISSSSSSSSL